MVKLSIVIPALNEEKYLPKLLRSIKSQNFKDYEVIVADANSKDKTRQIAKSFGCKIVLGGAPPAKGRNNGAKFAKGKHILFFDSDVVIPENFLSASLSEFEERDLDIAICHPLPIENTPANRIFLGGINLFNDIVKNIKPFGGGYCILAKKELHKKLKGYDEKLFCLEDGDYLQRAVKKGAKYGILKPRPLLSMRRFVAEGRLHTIYRWVSIYLHIAKGRELTHDLKKHRKYRYEYDYKK